MLEICLVILEFQICQYVMNTSTLCDGALLKNLFGLIFLRSAELDSSNLTAKFWFKIESESGSRKSNSVNWLNESIVWFHQSILWCVFNLKSMVAI